MIICESIDNRDGDNVVNSSDLNHIQIEFSPETCKGADIHIHFVR